MNPPTLDGLAVFGSICSVVTPTGPRASDTRSTFGIDGLEQVDGGSRGNRTHVAGWLAGNGPSGLASAEGLVRSLNDGVARTLVDPLGTAWPDVLLTRFEPTGRIRQGPDGTLFRPFRAELLHLT